MSIAKLQPARTAGGDLLIEAEQLLEAGYLVPAVATIRAAIEQSALRTGRAAGLWPSDRRPIHIGRIGHVLRKNKVVEEQLLSQTVEMCNKLSLYAQAPNMGPFGTADLIYEARTLCGRHSRIQKKLFEER